MKIINTDEVRPTDVTKWEADQIYNGMDCMMTAEVLDVLLPQLDNLTGATYNFSRELQGPVLEMRLRGLLVDQARRSAVLDELFERLEILERNLEQIVLDGVGMPHFNWRSNDHLKELFYDRLQIPVVIRRGKPAVDRSALEKIEQYIIAQPIVNHLTALKDLGKKIGVLRTAVDPDGRIRTSYNIAGTDTGRFSSSVSEFGTGSNLQNIEESLRSILIADPGYKFAKFDGKQLQSRVVGAIEWHLFQDGRYLDACESSDLHTLVAKMVWPDLAWTGDLAQDKAIAEAKFYRHYSRRDMCKKLGHGSNFEGKPPTLSSQTKVPINLVRDFQPKYYHAFPAHEQWHEWVREQIWRTGTIISITGRKRQFWGRRNDDSTIRGAIAYDPQATEAFVVNTAMLNIWRKGIALIMMQDHDALTFMYREEDEDRVVPELMDNLIVPVPLAHGRELRIPYDAQVGWNRGKYDPKKNPDGLRDYEPGDGGRKRQPQVSILDRIVTNRGGRRHG